MKDSFTTRFDLEFNNSYLPASLSLSIKTLGELKTNIHHFLHPNEIGYFSSLRYPKRQYTYLIGRYCAKNALIALHDDITSAIDIENGVLQQPIVHSNVLKNTQVSISHTDNMGAAIAFTENTPMGIDIESISDDKVNTLQKFLTTSEQNLTQNFAVPISAQLVLIWSIKEALSKVLKCGLMVNPDILELSSITEQNNYFVSTFKNFHQYQGLSFLITNTICSIVYPKNAIQNLDVHKMKNLFEANN